MQVVVINLAEKGLILRWKLQVCGEVQSEAINCANMPGSKATHICGASAAEKADGVGSTVIHTKVNLQGKDPK